MVSSKVAPLPFNVPIVDKEGNPTAFFQETLTQLLKEKAATDALAANALAITDDSVNWSAGFYRTVPPLFGLSFGDNRVEGTITVAKGDAISPGTFEVDLPANGGGMLVGGVSHNRVLLASYGAITGLEFSATPYVNTFAIFNAGEKAVTLASAATGAGLNLPHGAAPTTPVNGDVWTTAAGIYVRINGATIGPLSAGSGGGSTQKYAGVLNIALRTSTVFGSGFWGGRAILFPFDCTITNVVIRATAAAATCKLQPAIYSSNADGTINRLVASGSQVTGVVAGENLLPLTTPLVVTAGTVLYVGMVCSVIAFNAATSVGNGGGSYASSTVLDPPGTMTYGNAGWASMYVKLQ